MTNLYIDQLTNAPMDVDLANKSLITQDFRLRDLERLTPGSKVLFIHLPPLNDDLLITHMGSIPYTSVELAIITEVKDASFDDLHPLAVENPNRATQTAEQLEWATEKKPVIFYNRHPALLTPNISHRYASDSGVIPYSPSGMYNDTNFTVLMDDLNEAGVELSTLPSPEYSAILEEYKRKISKELSDLSYSIHQIFN